MSFLSKMLIKNARPMAEKAKDAVGQNADKVGDGIDKVASAVDGRTKGKHSAKIDKAAGRAKQLVDKAEADRRRRRQPPPAPQ